MVKTIDVLLKEANICGNNGLKTKIKFTGVEGYDVYNITAPFSDKGITVIAGRVEKRDSEFSTIRFFEKVSEFEYKLLEDYRTFELQDPYIAFINGELVLGGTEIFLDENEKLIYRAAKYRGSDVANLERFFEGPIGMKDIRLVELEDGVMVFTRPQGEIGGRGKIGFVKINKLEDLTIDLINEAELFDQFISEEWGGANEVYKLNSDVLGILGHIAKFDEEGNRHYYPMTFTFNHKTKEITPAVILCTRSMLEDGEAKRNDLIDVIFSGGLRKINKDKIDFYCGVSDCEAHKITLDNPFKEYELC